jgi:hypothetical protein
LSEDNIPLKIEEEVLEDWLNSLGYGKNNKDIQQNTDIDKVFEDTEENDAWNMLTEDINRSNRIEDEFCNYVDSKYASLLEKEICNLKYQNDFLNQQLSFTIQQLGL